MGKLCAALFFLWASVSAPLLANEDVTVAECVESDGEAWFRATCPPGSTKVADKKLVGVIPDKPLTAADVAAATPVLLYSVPECDACDLVRHMLSERQIPFNEKSVHDNVANQEEMQQNTGGLSVPALMVGTNVLSGYSRSAIDSALNQAGFPPPPPAPPSDSAAASAAADQP
jgi:glutaredoxin